MRRLTENAVEIRPGCATGAEAKAHNVQEARHVWTADYVHCSKIFFVAFSCIRAFKRFEILLNDCERDWHFQYLFTA